MNIFDLLKLKFKDNKDLKFEKDENDKDTFYYVFDEGSSNMSVYHKISILDLDLENYERIAEIVKISNFLSFDFYYENTKFLFKQMSDTKKIAEYDFIKLLINLDNDYVIYFMYDITANRFDIKVESYLERHITNLSEIIAKEEDLKVLKNCLYELFLTFTNISFSHPKNINRLKYLTENNNPIIGLKNNTLTMVENIFESYYK